MPRFQFFITAFALVTLVTTLGCSQAESQLPATATDAEVQQLKADEQRVAAEETARLKQGL